MNGLYYKIASSVGINSFFDGRHNSKRKGPRGRNHRARRIVYNSLDDSLKCFSFSSLNEFGEWVIRGQRIC
jgi:hypothetical protein